MEFIDFKDDLPKTKGIYKVKIKKSSGLEVETLANWTDKHGFIPLADNLLPSEYVFAWRKV